jgi:hypothetical protein
MASRATYSGRDVLRGARPRPALWPARLLGLKIHASRRPKPEQCARPYPYGIVLVSACVYNRRQWVVWFAEEYRTSHRLAPAPDAERYAETNAASGNRPQRQLAVVVLKHYRAVVGHLSLKPDLATGFMACPNEVEVDVPRKSIHAPHRHLRLRWLRRASSGSSRFCCCFGGSALMLSDELGLSLMH